MQFVGKPVAVLLTIFSLMLVAIYGIAALISMP